MRLIALLILGGLLGILGGVWQAKAFVTQNKMQIGQELDEAQRLAIVNSDGQAEKISESGMVTSNVLPRVEVIGGTDFDFGTMKRGTKRSHQFIFKNSGEAPLKLWVENSTCKCTVGSVTENYIQPGEETPVKLEWKAEGIQADFAQTATIGTTDPRMREVKLTITGRIGDNYLLSPDFLSLDEFSSNDTVVKKFKLYAMEDTPLQCSGYWGDLDLMEIVKVTHEVQKLEPGADPQFADARWVAEFTVTFNPGMPAGPINGQVRLQVGPDEIPMSVPTTGKVVSDLRIIASTNYDEERNFIDLGDFSGTEGGESASFYVAALSDRQDLTLDIGQILPESLSNLVKFEIGEPIRSERKTLFPVKLVIPPGTAPIDRGGTNPKNFAMVTFKANIENSGEIQLFLRFRVK